MRALVADRSSEEALSVREVATIVGKPTQTVNAWIRKRKPTPLWSPDSWTANERGVRALPIGQLNEAALTGLQRERLLLAQLRHRRPRQAA